MLKGYVEELLALEPAAWERVAYLHEPQAKRLSPERRHTLLTEARDCGKRAAAGLRERYGDCPVRRLVGLCGGRIFESDDPPDPYYALFASFEKPDKITVNRASVAKGEQTMADGGLEPLLGKVDIGDLLLSHELYHLLESRSGGDSFVKQRHACVLKLGGFRLMRRVDCLEEVAAMAFASGLLGLNFPPYIFNVVLLYAFYPQQAAKMTADYVGNGGQA